MRLPTLLAIVFMSTCCATAPHVGLNLEPLDPVGPSDYVSLQPPKMAQAEPVSVDVDEDVAYIDFHGPVEGGTVQDAIAKINAANERGARVIVIEFNTPGGSVDDGLLLAKVIERSAAPVHCVVDGESASMGFYLLQSCAVRAMTHRSTLMAHEPGIYGGGGGKKEEFRRVYEYLNVSSKAMNRHEAARLCISYEEFSEKIDGEDWWMDMEEAMEVCAVDRVVLSVPGYIRELKEAQPERLSPAEIP